MNKGPAFQEWCRLRSKLESRPLPLRWLSFGLRGRVRMAQEEAQAEVTYRRIVEGEITLRDAIRLEGR